MGFYRDYDILILCALHTHPLYYWAILVEYCDSLMSLHFIAAHRKKVMWDFIIKWLIINGWISASDDILQTTDDTARLSTFNLNGQEHYDSEDVTF